jgi:hypothetical protein
MAWPMLQFEAERKLICIIGTVNEEVISAGLKTSCPGAMMSTGLATSFHAIEHLAALS